MSHAIALSFARRHWRALAHACLCGAAFVVAIDAAAAIKPDDVPYSAPPAPDGSPITDTYQYDPAFGGEGYFFEYFGGPESANYNGGKIARLEDGSYVVAGRVPRPDSVEVTQLGLVHYSPSGRRMAWNSVNPAYGESNNEYIVYPQGNGGQPTGNFVQVVQIEAWNGNLYVLANESDGSYVHPIMLTFTYDGFFRGWSTFFPGGDVRKPGVGFAIDKGVKTITVLGSDPNNSSYNQLWMSRYTINTDGSLASDSSFPFTFFSMGSGRCDPGAVIAGHCSLLPAAITTGGTRLMFPPPAAGLYVAATLFFSASGDTDACVIRFNANGSTSTSFGTEGDGARCINFDDGGNKADRAVAIARTSTYAISGAVNDTIYLAASVARDTLPGIGVASLDGAGANTTAFGAGGKTVFGGCGSGAGNCNFVNVENTPLAMTYQNGQLGIAGFYRAYNDSAHTDVRFTDPLFALLDASSGAIRDFDNHHTLAHDSTFADIVGDGSGRFAAAGFGASDEPPYAMAFLAARLQPDDVIFHDGFE